MVISLPYFSIYLPFVLYIADVKECDFSADQNDGLMVLPWEGETPKPIILIGWKISWGIIDLNWCNSKIAIRIFQIVVSDRFIHSLTLNFVTWLVLRRFVQALNPFCSAILEMWGSFWIGVRYEWLSVDIGKKSLWM